MPEKIRVLYVDDEEALLEIGKMFLEENREFSVIIAISAIAALDIFSREHFDVIVSDYQMPKMDGISFLKAVRERYGDIPFILFTGRGREEVVIDAINNGADFYLQKGGDPTAQFAELSHKIRQALRRKQAEVTLTENLDYLSQIYSSVQGGIVIIDAKTHEIIDLNPAAERIIGTTKDQIAGNICHKFICPAEKGRCPITDLHQKVDNSERVLLTSDGKKVDIIKYVVPFTHHGRECLLETFLDNTERKLAADKLRSAYEKLTVAEEELRQNYDTLSKKEQALRESEEQLRATNAYLTNLITYANNPIVTWDINSRITRFNKAFEMLTGFSETNMLGHDFDILFPEESRADSLDLICRALFGEKWEAVEIPIRTVYGETRTVIWNSANIYAADGITPAATIAMGTDITDRKKAELELLRKNEEISAAYEELTAIEEETRANYDLVSQKEQALRESTETFRAVVEQSNEGIIIVDFTGRLLFANRKAAEIVDSAEDLDTTGRINMLDFVSPDSRDNAVSAFSEVAGGHDQFLANYQITTLANMEKWLECTGRKISFKESPAMLLSFRDVTERIQEEEELSLVHDEVRRKLDEERIVSDFSQFVLKASSVEEILDTYSKIIFSKSGADYLMLAKLDPVQNTIGIHTLQGFGPLLKQIGRLVSAAPESLKVPVEVIKAQQDRVPLELGLKKIDGGIATISRGYLPKTVCIGIEKVLGVKTIYSYEFVWEGNLYGSITFGFKQGNEIQNPALITTLSNLLANGLWRIYSADAIISERKSLAESESKFRTIFENSPYPIAINSYPDNKFLEVNASFLNVSGYSAEQILGKNPIELGLISLPDATKLISRQLLEGKTENEPLALTAQGGRRIHVLFTTIPVTINDKPATLTVAAETTRLKRVEEELLQKNEDLKAAYEELAATDEELRGNYEELSRQEQALRESEEKYRLIADNTADNIWIFNMDFTLKYISPSVKKLKGFTVEESLAMPVEAMMTPASYESVLKRFQEEMALEATGSADPDRVVSFETEEYCKDGSTIIVENSVVLLRDAQQNPIGILGVSRDITERIRTEETLRQSEEIFREVFNNANDMIELVENIPGGPGRFVLVNDRTVQMTGYSRDELLQMSPMDLVPLESMEIIPPDMMKKFASTGEAIFESAYRRKDGSIAPAEVSIHTFRYRENDVALSIVRDITERKKAEEALRQANKKLNLLSGITRHDIKNQILTLDSYVALLRRNIPDPDPMTEKYFSSIIKASRQISSMIQFTKEYEQVGVYHPVWQDLQNLVNDAGKGVMPGKVTLKNDIPANTEVFADPLITKVFFNLIDNALRHGGTITTIRFALETRDGACIIICEDDGNSIAAEQKERIFDKGFGKNTGFGLFISREVLDITGITIKENGVFGKGARFEITVPHGVYRFAEAVIPGEGYT